jgi:hypothetical protein
MKLIFFILLLILVVVGITTTQYVNKNKRYDLKEDGCCVLKNVIDKNEIDKLHSMCVNGDYKQVKENIIQNKEIHDKLHKIISDDYIFQDYIWIIQKSAVHTCHRDNNGDFFNEGQQHPSYTMLLYLEDIFKNASQTTRTVVPTDKLGQIVLVEDILDIIYEVLLGIESKMDVFTPIKPDLDALEKRQKMGELYPKE